MSDKADDETAPQRDEKLDRAAAPTARHRARESESLIGGDPLGLGGTTDPDAPSQHPRPKFVSLVVEFFKMSRTTAALLVAFVLLGALYLTVKQDPVVGIGTPSDRPTTTETTPEQPAEQTPDDEVPTGGTDTEDPSPVPTTGPTPTTAPPPGQQGRTTADPTATVDPQAPQQQGLEQGGPQQQEPQQQTQVPAN